MSSMGIATCTVEVALQVLGMTIKEAIPKSLCSNFLQIVRGLDKRVRCIYKW